MPQWPVRLVLGLYRRECISCRFSDVPWLRLSFFYRQCLSRPLLRLPPDLQSLIPWHTFSTSRLVILKIPRPHQPRRLPPKQKMNLLHPQTEGITRPELQTTQNPLTRVVRSPTPYLYRALRPLLIPPSFPSSLLPVTPIFELPPSQERVTETDPSSITTIARASLSPNTHKADIRPVFQRFGKVKHIFVHPGGRRADVVYVDVHGVKRALHA
ncbi:hypothetical protein DFH94DRAFT_705224 [Russula ochroleuca]|uniref:RRM domain-containing protein n=1 Tax=Russula ochroleuca TaxID=152965 RepID=A0A9P5TEG8_9AGAM|nr:hypothetical protein DFH94DRAFT_705224 [Russula ochroleuca]